MWSGLTDSETRFTDFHVEEDDDGLPKAVFDQLSPEQGSLLSYLLYPDKGFVGEIYLELLKVSEGEFSEVCYEDNLFKFSAGSGCVEVESKEPSGETGACAKVELSLGEAKFLLLKWTFECMRWEAERCR